MWVRVGVGVIPSTPGHELFSLTSCDRVVSGLLRSGLLRSGLRAKVAVYSGLCTSGSL